MFFGREDIFQWIENSIAGQYADHILVIHGQRRVGKTSVLKQLGNRLPKRFIPVFFDLQGRTHTTIDHFLWWLAREIARVVKQERGSEIPPPEKQAFQADPEFFDSQFLAGLLPELRDHTLLLTFDEFDNLEESEIKETLSRPLIDYLRRLRGVEGLNFIFSIGSSGRKLENMQAAYTEFFKTALYKKISFLNEEQTRSLITRPVEGVLEYERGAVDRIYAITSGHPYFTQLTCHELFARCQRTGQRKVAQTDVEAILDDVVERGTVNLKFVWDEAADIEKWSLAALAQLDKGDNRTVAEFLRRNRVRFSESDLTSGLLRLREKDVLNAENRFVIHLMRLWLQKNRPIEQAREELTEANPIASRFIEIGLEFRESGEYDKAIEYFRQAIAVSADNVQAQVNISMTYAAQGQLDQAVSEFEKALVLDDEDVASRAGLCEAHLKLGDIALSKKRAAEAIRSFQRILQINAEHTEARQRMAQIARQRAEKALADGREEEALAAFSEAIEFTPEDPALVERVEKVMTEKKAKALAARLAQVEDDAQAGKWEAAFEALNAVLAVEPDNAEIREKLAGLRVQQHASELDAARTQARGLASAGQFEAALQVWQAHLSLHPDDSEQVGAETARITKERELFELYTQASQAMAGRDFDQAISLLKNIILRDENYKDASRLLAKAIELRRAAPAQKPKQPREKLERQHPPARPAIKKLRPTDGAAVELPPKPPVAPALRRARIKINGKTMRIAGIAAAFLVLVAGGVFFGPRAWASLSTALQRAPMAEETHSPTPSPSASPRPTETALPTDTPTPTLLSLPISISPDLILAYFAEQPPNFEEDFTTPYTTWGFTSEGYLLYTLVQDGVLVIEDHVQGDAAKPDAAIPGVSFPDNIWLDGVNFALRFEFAFGDPNPADSMAVKFRSNEIVFDRAGSWTLNSIQGTQKTYISGGNWAGKELLIVAYNEYLAIFLDRALLYATDASIPSGSDNLITVTGAHGSKVQFDNIEFWNLNNVEFK
jgi:tetratricopeptide (TPR) repeat protein